MLIFLLEFSHVSDVCNIAKNRVSLKNASFVLHQNNIKKP